MPVAGQENGANVVVVGWVVVEVVVELGVDVTVAVSNFNNKKILIEIKSKVLALKVP